MDRNAVVVKHSISVVSSNSLLLSELGKKFNYYMEIIRWLIKRNVILLHKCWQELSATLCLKHVNINTVGYRVCVLEILLNCSACINLRIQQLYSSSISDVTVGKDMFRGPHYRNRNQRPTCGPVLYRKMRANFGTLKMVVFRHIANFLHLYESL